MSGQNDRSVGRRGRIHHITYLLQKCSHCKLTSLALEVIVCSLKNLFLSGLKVYLYLQEKGLCEFISKSPNDTGPRMSSLSHCPFNKFLAPLVPNLESWHSMLCPGFQEPKQVRCHSKPYQKYEHLLLVTLDTKISFVILLCRSCRLKL